MKKLITYIVAIGLLLSTTFANAAVVPGHDKEMCRKFSDGSEVKITLLACPVTTHGSFYRADWTAPDGTTGKGCWIGDSNFISIYWEDFPGPASLYSTGKFRSCDLPFDPEIGDQLP